MPRDYVRRLMRDADAFRFAASSAPWARRAGRRASPLRSNERFLNTYQARWQYAAETLGFGFTPGGTMCCRQREDSRSGRRDRGAGGRDHPGAPLRPGRGSSTAPDLRAHIASPPSDVAASPPRSLRDVWARQVRWARLRRATFPLLFRPRDRPPPACADARRGGDRRRPDSASAAPAAVVFRGDDLVRRRSGAGRRRRLVARLVVARRLDGAPTRCCPRCGSAAG